MAKYPALQDEVERICMTHIRGVEQNTKEQVKSHNSNFDKIIKLTFLYVIMYQGVSGLSSFTLNYQIIIFL